MYKNGRLNLSVVYIQLGILKFEYYNINVYKSLKSLECHKPILILEDTKCVTKLFTNAFHLNGSLKSYNTARKWE